MKDTMQNDGRGLGQIPSLQLIQKNDKLVGREGVKSLYYDFFVSQVYDI